MSAKKLFLLHSGFLLFASISFSGNIFGQSRKDTIHISLKAALDTAVANYPRIKAALADKKSAEEDVKSSQTAYIPALQFQDQLSYATANSMTGSFFPNPGTGVSISGGVTATQNWNAASGQFTTAVLTGPIYAFGKITANIHQKEAELMVTDAVYQNELFQQKVKVSEAYLFLLVYEKLRAVQLQNLIRATDVNNLIKSAVSSGLKPGVDSSFSAAEVSKAKISYLNSIGDEQNWQLRFGESLGKSGYYYVVDTLGFSSSLPTANVSKSVINNNPLLGIYIHQADRDLFAAKAARRAYLPTFNYFATGSARGSGITNTGVYDAGFSDGIQLQRYNYMAGAYLLWNISDIFRTSHDYKSRMFNVERDRDLLDQTTLTLNSELENANVQLGLALQAAREAPIQLNAASAGFAQSRARYQSGLATLEELSQNLFVLARAEADYSITYNNTWRSLLSVAAATGDITLFLNSVQAK